MRHHLRADKMALWNSLVPTLVQTETHDLGMRHITLPQPRTLAWIFVAVCVVLGVAFLVILALWIHVRLRRQPMTKFYVDEKPCKV